MAQGTPHVPFKSMPQTNSLPTKGSRDTPGCHEAALCCSARSILGREDSGVRGKADFREAVWAQETVDKGGDSYSAPSYLVPEAGVPSPCP